MTMPTGEGVNLGNAYGYVDIDVSNVDKNLKNLQNQFDGFVSKTMQSVSQFGQNMANFGMGLTQMMTPVAAVGAVGIRTAANFQDSMAEIAARTGLTGEALDAIRDKALRLGADTQFSTQQAADAFLQLLTSGSSVEQAMLQIDAVLAGAAASGADLGFAADALTDVMATMGLEAEQSYEAMQILIDATGSSSATFSDMAQGFGNVGPIAKDFGLSMEETAAILAVFNENGIKGAEAGTNLKSMLLGLASPTKSTQQAWNKLGISLFDAEGNVRNINDVLLDLEDKMSTLSDEERIRLSNALAGSFGQVGLSALVASGGIGDMLHTMSQQADMSEIAEKRMSTFNGQITSLMGSMQVLLIETFTPFLDFLAPLISQAIDVVNALSAWVKENEALTLQVVKFLGVLTTMGPLLVGLGKALFLIGTLNPLTIGLSAVALFGALVISRMDKIVAALSRLKTWSEDTGKSMWHFVFRPFEDGSAFITSFIEDATGIPAEMLNQFYVPMYEQAQNFIGTMRQIFSTLFKRDFIGGGMLHEDSPIIGFLLYAHDVVQRLRMSIDWFIDDIRNYGLVEAIYSMFGVGQGDAAGQSWLEGLLVTLGLGRDMSQEIVQSMLKMYLRFETVVRRVHRAVKPLAEEIGEFIGNLFGGIGSNIDFEKHLKPMLQIGSTLMALTNPIGQVMTVMRMAGVDFIALFERGAGILTRFFGSLNDGVGILDSVRYALDNPYWLEYTIQLFGNMATWIQTRVIPAIQNLKTWFVDTLLSAVVGWVQGRAIPAVQGFVGWLVNIWQVASPYLTALGNWFLNAVLPRIIGIGQSAIKLFGAVASTLMEMWTIAKPHLAELAKWFLDDALPAIGTFISETALPFIEDLIGWLTKIWLDVEPHLLNLYSWFVETAIPAIINFWNTTLKPAIDTVIGWLQTIWTAVKPKLDEMYKWFVTDGLGGIVTFITETIPGYWSGFTDLLAGIWDAVSPGFTALKDGLIAAWNWIKEKVIDPMIEGFNDAINLWRDITNMGINWSGGNNKDAILEGLENGDWSWWDVLGQAGKSAWGEFFGGGKAMGGSVMANTPYLVGERGPELMIPQQTGTIVPNHDLGSMMRGVTIQQIVIHASGYQEGREAGRGLRDELERYLAYSGGAGLEFS